MVKFLIIRFSSIGDIILTTPVIRNLKTQVEGAEIHFLTKKAYSSVLEENPYIDKLHLYDNNFSEIISELKTVGIDFIIDLHNNLRSSRVKLALNRVTYAFPKLNIQKWLLVNLKVNKMPDLHIVDRYMKTLDMFNVKNDHLGLDFYIRADNEMNIMNLPEPYHNGYIALVIGANHKTKQLPDERIIALVKKLNYPILILGGKDDAERGEAISKECGTQCISFCGKLSLQQSASFVKQARFVITPDTGLMHIASAYKKNILSIWGNTVPAFGMFPYLPGENSEIFQVTDLKCRPCSKIGYEKCPLKHFRCMNDIDLDSIAIKASKLMYS